MMLTLRISSRDRYVRAINHLYSNHKYQVVSRGKDYSASQKDVARGYGWYINFLDLTK